MHKQYFATISTFIFREHNLVNGRKKEEKGKNMDKMDNGKESSKSKFLKE